MIVTALFVWSFFTGLPTNFQLEATPGARTLPLINSADEALIASSYCPEGCRFDRNAPGEARALYWLGQDAVLFEDFGVGMVTRFWCTQGLYTSEPLSDKMRIIIEVDGTEIANIPLATMFDASTPPFLMPLTYGRLAASGGNLSVAPITYGQHCRIRLTNASVEKIWFQVHFRRAGDTTRVQQAWPPDPSWSAWLNLTDPWHELPGRTVTETLVLNPGGAAMAQMIDGPNVITAVSVDIPFSLRQDIYLRLGFDGAMRVDMPLLDWTGPQSTITSRAFGETTGDRWFAYYPMPFWSTAFLSLSDPNQALTEPLTITLTRRLLDKPPLAGSGYLTAQVIQASPAGPAGPLLMADMLGSGKWLVNNLTIANAGPGGLNILEGDERIYRDGNTWPDQIGTGLEDFYGGGFYFRNDAAVPQPFERELHGLVHYQASDDNHDLSMYRTMVLDAVPFSRSLKATMELGPTGGLTANGRSVNIFYLRDGRSTLQTPARRPANKQGLFPDAVLADYLATHAWLDEAGNEKPIDTNGNGTIETAEATAVTGYLDLSRVQANNLTGLESFTELRGLHIDGSALQGTLNLSGPAKLQHLSISHHDKLHTIKLSLAELTNLRITNLPSLGGLDLTETPNLKHILLDNLPLLSSVTFGDTAPPAAWNLLHCNLLPPDSGAIRQLSIRGGKAPSSLNLARWPALRELRMTGVSGLVDLQLNQHNSVEAINVQGLPELRTIHASSANGLRRISIKGCSRLISAVFKNLPGLDRLDVSENDLTTFLLNQLPALTWLDLSHNRLAAIPDLTAAGLLHGLDISFNQLETIPRLPDSIAFLDTSANRLTHLADHTGQSQLFYADYSENILADAEPGRFSQAFGKGSNHVLDLRGNPFKPEACKNLATWTHHFGNQGNFQYEPTGLGWSRWPLISVVELLSSSPVNPLNCPPAKNL